MSLAALKPRLNLAGELSYAADGGQQYGSGGGAAVGATLSVPLYQGGGEYARVRQSKETLTQRRYGRDDARRATESAIVGAWAAGRTAAAVIRSVGRQVAAARFALDGVRQEAAIGARSVVDMLDAERELFAAEVTRACRARAGRGRLPAARRDRPVDGGRPGAAGGLRYAGHRARRWSRPLVRPRERYPMTRRRRTAARAAIRRAGEGEQGMADSKAAPEPSMEEILSSIRRIIAEDEPGGQSTAPDRPKPTTRTTTSSS